MDPDVTLATMREAIVTYTQSEAGTPAHDLAGDRAVEAAMALDVWLSKGGFPPRAWQSKEQT
jgi:hypothetical protein